MAETLGSLCDKLTIVKLKQFHCDDAVKLKDLAKQENQLKSEIDGFLHDAVFGIVPIDKLSFSSNKIYKEEGNKIKNIEGTMGQILAQLANINCELWHEQEKVYDFEKVPVDDKDNVVKRLAILNIERNKCIDKIDSIFKETVKRT